MEISEAEFRKAVENVKLLNRKLRAHEVIFVGMNHAYPEEHLDQKLKDQYDSPATREEFRRRYDVPMEKFLRTGDKNLVCRALLELLIGPPSATKAN